MAEERNTIGITARDQETLTTLNKDGFFSDDKDAALFAMAIAIYAGEQPGKLQEAKKTKWNIGSIDSNHHVRSLLTSIFPTIEDPTKALEFLISKGLQRIADSNSDVYDYLEQHRHT